MLATLYRGEVFPDSLREVLHWLDLGRMDVMSMLLDYCFMHDDELSSSYEHQGVIGVLLSAPRGCKFVVGQASRELLPGDVFIFDDHQAHGAYPLHKTDCFRAAGAGLEELQRYAESNCMAFLIMVLEK